MHDCTYIQLKHNLETLASYSPTLKTSHHIQNTTSNTRNSIFKLFFLLLAKIHKCDQTHYINFLSRLHWTFSRVKQMSYTNRIVILLVSFFLSSRFDTVNLLSLFPPMLMSKISFCWLEKDPSSVSLSLWVRTTHKRVKTIDCQIENIPNLSITSVLNYISITSCTGVHSHFKISNMTHYLF